MIRVYGFRTAATKRVCQPFKKILRISLTPFQDWIGKVVPIPSVGRSIIVLAPHIQEMCTLVRKLTLPWDRIGKGRKGVLPDRGIRLLCKGDSYIKILGYVLCLKNI